MLSGCKRTDQEESRTGFYFDTVISIQIDSGQDEQLLDDCFILCDEIEKIFSRTLPESELYKINHRSENQVEVSDEMALVIGAGLEYYELSGGALDITIAPLLDVWDFKSEDAAVPEAGQIARAAEKVGASKLSLDGNRLSFDSVDTQIDLGALAKGYAADRLKEYLVSQGVSSGLINLGGNVLAIGKKTDGTKWTVGIQMPFTLRNETVTTVQTEGESVVSSGVYERHFEAEGRYYHHILDPATGYPVESDLWQATIISESSLAGDALSTICILKGREEAQKLIDSIDGAEVIFVTDQGQLIK